MRDNRRLIAAPAGNTSYLYRGQLCRGNADLSALPRPRAATVLYDRQGDPAFVRSARQKLW